MLTCQKPLFSLPEAIHYLNGASMSPLLKSVEEAGIQGLLRKSQPHTIHQEDYFTDVDRVRQLFGQLVHVPYERVAIIPSVSYGMAIVAKNLNARPGQHILLVADEFPSDVYAWEEVCQTQAISLKTISRTGDGKSWNEAVLDAISEETALLMIAPIHWSDGTRFDIEALSKRCRETGTLFVLDGTQTVGALPLDLTEVSVDALIVGGYKWLLGTYGMGLAYFGPAFDEGRSIEQSWINRKGSDNFRLLMAYTTEFRPGASRYSMGEQSNFIQIPMLATALEQILAWTPEAVQAYSEALVRPHVAHWQELGFWIEAEAYRSSHLFGLRHEGLDMNRLRTELERHQVYISTRGTTLRIATHVYNEAADLEALTEALSASL
ncbi:aminotransferase [Siphonobacter sp. BAB-5385]|uniref:aminotransferase class V-fold PLP-dependent enzyme n=1 Tax=Siphonobacter sp. BAB-5385 TaxID=1864822 RepID=UPI000B9DF287|nr:aminotransferase class V-fold PLP-dependent enzyme [Siphonobacter sp. BAB-5385]OZI07816.1 aminotransferase [Siphonobacter sp. BAB-5385]